jgi:hypothetical protein
MLDEHHASFDTPQDMDLCLWRYLDLAKFLSMLSTSSVAFVRADLLGDEWEGALTASMARARDQEIARVEALPPQPVTAIPFDAASRKAMRESAYISCWRMSPTEDAAMWGVYAGRGIAIRTTFRHLVDAIDPACTVMAGKVHYVDFDSDEFPPEDTLYSALMYKRIEFEFDRELRLAVSPDVRDWEKREWLYRQKDGSVCEAWRLIGPAVIPVPVDLVTLLDQVVLAPNMPEWTLGPLRELLTRFDVNHVPLSPSRLSYSPSF